MRDPGRITHPIHYLIWARQDLNLRPGGYEPLALTTELRARWPSTDLSCRDKRAGDGIRTREYQLGRLMPYHLATPAKSFAGVPPDNSLVSPSRENCIIL